MSSDQGIERPRFPLWVVVVSGGVITALSLGVRSTFGLLLEPIAEGLDSDLGSISFAIAIQNLLWGFSQPIAGAVSDRFGAARTLAAGGLLYVVALALMSTASSSGMVLLSGGFLTGAAIGAASFAVVLSAVGRLTPPERRSMVLGVVSAIGSLGQFVMIPVARWLLDTGSWERTSVALAIVLIPIVLLAPAFRSARPVSGVIADVAPVSKAPLRSDLRRASRSPSYLMLNGAFFVCGFHVTFIGVHLTGFVEGEKLAASTAATALALIGLFNVFGSLLAGRLGQTFPLSMILASIYGLRAVVIGLYVLLPTSGASTVIFGMAIGILWLSTVAPTGAIVVQQFGSANSGALFGIVFLSHQLGSFISAWAGGELVDATGSYAIMWWLSVALGVFAMALHLVIDEGPVPEPPPGRAGMQIAPAGIGVVVLVAGLTAAASTIDAAEASELSGRATPAFYCPLGSSG